MQTKKVLRHKRAAETQLILCQPIIRAKPDKILHVFLALAAVSRCFICFDSVWQCFENDCNHSKIKTVNTLVSCVSSFSFLQPNQLYRSNKQTVRRWIWVNWTSVFRALMSSLLSWAIRLLACWTKVSNSKAFSFISSRSIEPNCKSFFWTNRMHHCLPMQELSHIQRDPKACQGRKCHQWRS